MDPGDQTPMSPQSYKESHTHDCDDEKNFVIQAKADNMNNGYSYERTF